MVMQVRHGMTPIVLTVGPGHSLREAAQLMSRREVGSAVVVDADSFGPAIITERDLLHSIGAGEDPDVERVADHLTRELVLATPEWSLEEAASAMSRGRFRHLLVVDQGEVVGIISVRDIVRLWTDDGALCDMPSGGRRDSLAHAS
jgi:CBS domain-containing protein